MLRIGLILSVTGILAVICGTLGWQHYLSRRSAIIIGAVLFMAGLPFLVLATR